MRIAFDPGKDASNREKHGLSLARAAAIDLNAVVLADERQEPR